MFLSHGRDVLVVKCIKSVRVAHHWQWWLFCRPCTSWLPGHSCHFYLPKEHRLAPQPLSLVNEMKNWEQFLFGPVFTMDKMPKPVDASR